MTLLAGAQSVPGNAFMNAVGLTPSFTNSALLTNTGHKIAWVGRMCNKDRSSKQIRFVEFRWGSAITSIVLTTLQVSIQGVSNSAGPPFQPDGVISGATNNALAAIAAATPSASAWFTSTNFTEDSTSIAHGQLMAVVLEYTNFVATDSIGISGLTFQSSGGTPYNQGGMVAFNTGAWVINTGYVMNIVLGFTDGTYGTLMGAYPASATSTTAINNTSGNRQVGLEITPTVAFSIDGVDYALQMAPNAEMDINFYTGTSLTETVAGIGVSSPSVDLNSINASNSAKWSPQVLSQSRDLAAATTYRLMLKPTTANNITLYDISVNTAAHRQCYPMGADVQYVVADSTPTFTGTSTKLPLMLPGICGWGSGGGGVVKFAGDGGGFVG